MPKLKPHQQPDVWFFFTVQESNKKGVPRARLHASQFIPLADEEESFVLSNDNLNVEAPHELRKGNPIGTIFAAMSMTLVSTPGRAPYYSTKGQEIYIVGGPDANAPEKVIKAWDSFNNGKTPRVQPVRVKKEVNKPIAASRLEILTSKYPLPTTEKQGFYVPETVWHRLIFNMDKGSNTLLTGPEGTGKTELAMLVGKMYGMEVDCFDMGSKLDPTTSLIGTHRHRADKGGSYFDRAKFTYCIEKPNLIILDEVSRSASSSNNILFSLLDSRRELSMDGELHESAKTIKMNKEARIIATANEGSQFSGTISLDPAFKRRFKVIKLGYLPDDEEIKLLIKRTQVGSKPAETIVMIANRLRDLYRNGDLSLGISTSHTLDAAEMVEGGFDLPTALELSFLPSFSNEDEEIVTDILSSR